MIVNYFCYIVDNVFITSKNNVMKISCCLLLSLIVCRIECMCLCVLNGFIVLIFTDRVFIYFFVNVVVVNFV